MKILLSKLFTISILSIALLFIQVSSFSQNLGFEQNSGRTEWNSFNSGSWSFNNSYTSLATAELWDYPAYIRSGSRGVLIQPNSLISGNQWYLPNYSVTTPVSGSGYYIHVLGYARQEVASASSIAAGIRKNNATTINATAFTPGTTAFGMFSYNAAATNGTTYSPAFEVKKKGLTNGAVGVDDIVLYYDTNAAADVTAPAAASDILLSVNGGNFTCSFSEGSDGTGSGTDGYLVLRTSGVGVTTPVVSTQTVYDANTAIGPNNLVVTSPYESWTVLSNSRTANGAFSDQLSGTATYLVYMRDKAYNYSAPKRIVVMNGDASVNGSITADGLLLNSGKMQIESGVTFALSAGAPVVEKSGWIYINSGIFSIPANSTYTFNNPIENGNATFNIASGTKLTFNGIYKNLWGSAKLNIATGGEALFTTTSSLQNYDSGEISVQSGGKLTVNGAIINDMGAPKITLYGNSTFTLGKGTLLDFVIGTFTANSGANLNISGTINMRPNSTISINNSAKLIFNDGGRYNYYKTGGSLPLATWNTGSTCAFYGGDGGGTVAPANLNQAFYNFIWQWADQNTDIALNTNLTNVRGKLTINSTGSNFGLICNNTTSSTIFNWGGLELTAGKLTGASNKGACTFNINGDVNITGGSFTPTNYATPAKQLFNIEGGLQVSSPGQFSAYDGVTNQTEYVSQINFTNTSGANNASYLKLPAGLAYNRGAAWRFDVAGNRKITLLANVELGGSSSSSAKRCMVNVQTNGKFLCGAYVVKNAAGATNTAFVLNANATLGTGSADGITTSGSSGAIQTDTRTFTVPANYVYNGTVLQSAGNALPATVNQLTIDNPAGMQLLSNTTVNDTLFLTNGNFKLNDKKVTLNHTIIWKTGGLTGSILSELVIDNTQAPSLSLPKVVLRNLTVNRTNGITLSGRVHIYEKLQMQAGILNTQTDTVRLEAAATLSENETTYILGYVNTTHNIKTTFTNYTFGNIGITLNFKGAAAGLTAITRLTGYSIENQIKSITRAYEIHSSVKTGLNATMTLQYYKHEMKDLPQGVLAFFRSTDGGTNWTYRGQTVRDDVNNTMTLSGIDAFSTWTLGTQNTPLPVEMTVFTAKASGKDVVLNWATASEKNNAGFNVERSLDGRNWESIAYLTGANTTSATNYYNYTDSGALQHAQTLYYRIKQTDFDGNTAYSKVNAIRTSAEKLTLQVAALKPNTLNVTVSAPNNTVASLTLLDLSGRIILQNTISLKAGATSFQVATPGITGGAYILVIQTNEGALKQKVVFQP